MLPKRNGLGLGASGFDVVGAALSAADVC
jgi:hypothetical protein